jgi:hypothetical protein
MRRDTKKRKKATQHLKATQEQEWWANHVAQVMFSGKRALDATMLGIGKMKDSPYACCLFGPSAGS